MPREKSAGAVIFRKEEGKIYYLLIHYPGMNRKGGHWEFAKGHIEEGESYEETVRREVLEETGLKDIKIITGFKEHIKYFFLHKHDQKDKKKDVIFKLVTFFVAETKIRDVKLSHEHDGFIWLPIEDAIKQTTYKNSKELLKKANEFIVLKKGLSGGQKNTKRQSFNLQAGSRKNRQSQGIQSGRQYTK